MAIKDLMKKKKSAPVEDSSTNALPPEQGEVIDREAVRRANTILRRYQDGKKTLDSRLVANEQFYKMRQWDAVNGGGAAAQQKDVHSTAWLFSCIESRYADMMDSYPTANTRPRQQDDVEEANRLSAIIPVINEQLDMETTYSEVSRYALKHGTFAYSVLWDSSKHHGLGDISVNRVDLLSLYWEPGVTDIQESTNVFHLTLVDNALLESQYPAIKGKLGGKPVIKTEYRYDDKIRTDDKSIVVDWYYKVWSNGKKVLHYCKYVNDFVLFSTQNEGMESLYDHSMYPYVIVPLFPVEGSLAGYGYIDIGRDTQVQIDLLSKAIVENATMGASPRYFVSNGTKVNEKEFLDFTKKVIHVESGTVTDDELRPMESIPFSGNYINVLGTLVDQLKYTTANQDANNGIAPSGVTSASGIASLQEAAGKNARAVNKTAYRAFKDVTYMQIELIRQFYDAPRYFRITPDDAKESYELYTNKALKPQAIPGTEYLRLPEFDISITAERANPYRKMEMNELALNFYNMGFFNPQNADQVSACLSMMDFSGKRDVLQRVSANATLYQRLLQYQQIALNYAKQIDPQGAEIIAQDIMSGSGGALASLPSVTEGESVKESSLGGDDKEEHPFAEKARERTRESTVAD